MAGFGIPRNGGCARRVNPEPGAPRITASFTDEQRDWLVRQAKKRGTSIGAFIRDVVQHRIGVEQKLAARKAGN